MFLYIHRIARPAQKLVMKCNIMFIDSEVILGIGTTSTGEEVTSYGDYVNTLKERMQVAHEC